MRETVVYVHGLWASRADSVILRRRLARDFDFDVRVFRYPAVSSSIAEVIERLERFVAELAPRSLHFVGHSLGGLVIFRLFERHPSQPPGRVVLLGTPAFACRAAVTAARVGWAATMLGKCVAEELLVPRERHWSHARPLGIIAGTRALGLAPYLARLPGENDGTVAVSETRLPGAADHISVPASHMGLLISSRAARETGLFLREGHFALRPPAPFPSSPRSS